jgi:short-subunit dehydrogenase
LVAAKKTSGRARAGTALITGASSGIGRELARVFASEGHDLVLVARNQKALTELGKALQKECGVRVHAVARDLARPKAAEELLAFTRKKRLAVDVLVNNAGVLYRGDFASIDLERQLELVQLNVAMPTALTRLFVEPMLKRGHGRILNVASIAGFQPLPGLGSYAASKAYLLHFTEALSEELAGTGVTATALCPGFTETGMLEPALGRLPGFVVSSAAEVARDGYRACMAGSPVQVSGLVNQLATELVRYQPRWFVRALGGFMARSSR